MNLSPNLTLWLTQVYPSLQHCKSIMLSESLQHTNVLYSSSKKKINKIPSSLLHIPISSSDIAPCLPTSLFMTIPQRSYLYYYLAFLSSYSLWKPPQVSCPSHSTNTGFLSHGPPHSRWKGLFPILRLLELSPLTPFFTLSGDTFLKLDFSWILFSSHSQFLSHFSKLVSLSLLCWISSPPYPQNMKFSRISPLTSYFPSAAGGFYIAPFTALNTL